MRLIRRGFLRSSIHAVPCAAYVAGFTGRQRFTEKWLWRRWHGAVGACVLALHGDGCLVRVGSLAPMWSGDGSAWRYFKGRNAFIGLGCV
jgi:hypothetical protein